MPVVPQPVGRRERNKQEKLARITQAASELFAKYGVDEVTTQQIAQAADIGTGTLFLYAKTKGELLLLVQNMHYAKALERGVTAAAKTNKTLAGLMALLGPIVECNRVQTENGRTYLREMVFGDPTEPHHAEALEIVAQTEKAMAELLAERENLDAASAATMAQVISSIMFLTMAASFNSQATAKEIAQRVKAQIEVILPR
ncbi:TetR/AcrR family transcriptional regulator [Glutamicibacter mishrai]|uniref:TetR/AcrR family transcriptional regulator n=1 Tax=Glutamicibacter mishrai TaxID=1775880 RepID=A0A6H0SJD1_9MICC|nr:TetR/AcrR family transcriptional regulator [Glutamicibacter mishrai]QIV86519.1 TetR/AcrR family transcriptional regulator [Glutamicibacter mishrai]